MSASRLFVGFVAVAAVIGAIAWQQGVLKLGPDEKKADDTVDLYARATMEFQGVQYKDAYADFKQAIAAAPNDTRAPTAAFNMAKCLEEIRKPDEALQAYKDFVAKYPSSDQAATAKQRIEKLTLLGGH